MNNPNMPSLNQPQLAMPGSTGAMAQTPLTNMSNYLQGMGLSIPQNAGVTPNMPLGAQQPGIQAMPGMSGNYAANPLSTMAAMKFPQ